MSNSLGQVAASAEESEIFGGARASLGKGDAVIELDRVSRAAVLALAAVVLPDFLYYGGGDEAGGAVRSV